MQINKQQGMKSKIQIVGYFSSKINQSETSEQRHIADVIELKINHILQIKKKGQIFEPVSISVEANSIAIIDNQQRAWLITDHLKEPICISDLLKLKITSISMGYNQLIANTRDGSILFVWGTNKQLQSNLITEYPLRGFKSGCNHNFEAFLINQTQKGDRFNFSNLKKVTDSDSLFGISHKKPEQIISYPTLDRITFSHRVVGLSVGKYHKLCWDSQGKLFSWGCKSLALGHRDLPQDCLADQPQPVHNLTSFILKAYAGINYSLAVTLEGKVFEWGIKKFALKGQELIFDPQEIIFPKGQRILDIKGRGENFSALSVSGKLYIWGKKAKEYLSELQHYSTLQEKDFDNPVCLNHLTDFVIDFAMCESYLGVITSPKQQMEVSDSQKRYWINLKNKIGANLKYQSSNVRTEGCQQINEKSERKKQICLSLRKFVDPVEFAFIRRESKKKYFKIAENSEKIINDIMQKPQPQFYQHQFSFDPETNSSQWKQDLRQKPKKLSKASKIDVIRLFEECEKRKTYTQSLVKDVLTLQNKNKMYRIARNKSHKRKQYLAQLIEQKSYSSKLEEVLKKKDELNSQFFQKTLRKLENDSVQYRMKKKREMEEGRRKRKQIDACKHSLQKYLINAFLVKLLTKPAAEARQIKIQNFAYHLKLQRLQNKIRGVFIKNRIKIKMKKMIKNQLFRYFLLTVMFRKYVKRFRSRKFKHERKFVVQQLFKNVVKEKIKVGLAACTFNVRKLQKFREWVTMVRTQRKKCLKYMWKVYLLSTMKVNSENESSAIFYLPKNIEELSFQNLYFQKVLSNPLLKLSNFLQKYSIFKIKATYFQKLVTLFTFQTKMAKAKESGRGSKFINSFSRGKKGRIKFHEEDEVVDRLNLMQTDIFPYSMHFNLLIRPKNLDLSLPEMMKNHEKWIREERRVLQKHINIIIQENQVLQRKNRRNYDLELAHYINKNYSSLSQKRWKYIIEFNMTKPTLQKLKKEKELRRLLKLIGAQGKLEEDCLPEKYILLEQAQRRPDSPIFPNSNIIFTVSDFKRHFKSYFEAMFLKLKQYRRVCF